MSSYSNGKGIVYEYVCILVNNVITNYLKTSKVIQIVLLPNGKTLQFNN